MPEITPNTRTQIKEIVSAMLEVIEEPFSDEDLDGEYADELEKIEWLDDKLVTLSARLEALQKLL